MAHVRLAMAGYMSGVTVHQKYVLLAEVAIVDMCQALIPAVWLVMPTMNVIIAGQAKFTMAINAQHVAGQVKAIIQLRQRELVQSAMEAEALLFIAMHTLMVLGET
jgi:hypothetical protein